MRPYQIKNDDVLSRHLFERMLQAGGLGFEPRLTNSESAVLPLDEPPVISWGDFTIHGIIRPVFVGGPQKEWATHRVALIISVDAQPCVPTLKATRWLSVALSRWAQCVHRIEVCSSSVTRRMYRNLGG